VLTFSLASVVVELFTILWFFTMRYQKISGPMLPSGGRNWHLIYSVSPPLLILVNTILAFISITFDNLAKLNDHLVLFSPPPPSLWTLGLTIQESCLDFLSYLFIIDHLVCSTKHHLASMESTIHRPLWPSKPSFCLAQCIIYPLSIHSPPWSSKPSFQPGFCDTSTFDKKFYTHLI